MTLSRRVVALAAVVYGLAMMRGGPSAYTSTTYSVLFDLAAHLDPGHVAPTTVWGIGFVVAGGVALFPLRGNLDLFALALVLLLVAGWAIGLWAAVLIGQAETWGGPVWPSTLVVLVLVNAGRQTIR